MNGASGGGGGAGFSGANFQHSNVDPHEIFNMFFGSNDFGFGGTSSGAGGMGGFPGGFGGPGGFGSAHSFMNGHQSNPFGQSHQRARSVDVIFDLVLTLFPLDRVPSANRSQLSAGKWRNWRSICVST